MKTINLLRDKRGFIFILLAAFLMLALCAFAGLALDVGRAYVVKGQLQNGADASALAGAAAFYAGGTTAPNWSAAETAAAAFINKNSADGNTLKDCTVESGYWNITPASTHTLLPKTTTPGRCSVASATSCVTDGDCPLVIVGGSTVRDTCLYINVPAVKVTVNKAPGVNDGPMETFFSKVVGWNNFQPSAAGVALSGFPGSAPPGTTFPFAITSCLVDDFVNGSGIFTGNPTQLVTLTNAGNNVAISTTQGSMIAGQWTDLVPDATTNAATVSSYISYLQNPSGGKGKAPTPSPGVDVGDTINIASGDKTSLYHDTNSLLASGTSMVYMPVVNCNITPGGAMTVMGFVLFEITQCDSGGSKTIVGRFVQYSPTNPLLAGSGPGGSRSNEPIPPKMTQ